MLMFNEHASLQKAEPKTVQRISRSARAALEAMPSTVTWTTELKHVLTADKRVAVPRELRRIVHACAMHALRRARAAAAAAAAVATEIKEKVLERSKLDRRVLDALETPFARASVISSGTQ